MHAKTKARYEARARVLRALAHPMRLYLVDEVASRERCVTDLAVLAGADISTVFQHLAVLKSAGILEARRSGMRVYYRLRCPCVVNFFGCVEAVLKANARKEAALAR